MNLFYLSAILSSSILIGGIIALFRFKHIRKIYRPFIYLIWVGSINEILNYFLITNGHDNIVNSIIYGLCESLLLIWFFRNLKMFKGKQPVYHLLISVFVSFWIVESFFSKDFGSRFNSVFSIIYAFSIVLLSITAINKLLFEEKEILKHPTFLITGGMLIYFTYKIVVEMFWLYGLKESRSFRINVLVILMFINFLCNLIYALAIVWMRRKQAFTLRF